MRSKIWLSAALLVVSVGVLPAFGGDDLSRAWTARDAVTTLDFNQDLIRDLGIQIRDVKGGVAASVPGAFAFAAPRPYGLIFTAPHGAIENLVGGQLKHDGGLVLSWNGGSTSLIGFELRPGLEPMTLEIFDARGELVFIADHMHFKLDRSTGALRMFNLDLRLSEGFARKIGEPRHIGLAVAQMAIQTTIEQQIGDDDLFGGCGPAIWPGTAHPEGGTYDADVALTGMTSVSQMARAKFDFSPCDADRSTCYVVVAPSSTLMAAGTADVPWYQKNTGSFPPYNNDQHPYLVWAMFRLKDGAFEMLGQSGVKHAFLTVNSGCGCASGHILWAANGAAGHPATGCADTYGTGTNNSSGSQGLRSKINPFTGIWTNSGDDFTGFDNPRDRRLGVIDADLDQVEARYFFDSWYVVREDINIFNTIGWREIDPSFGGSTWSFGLLTGLTGGPAVDAWVNPAAPGAGNDSDRHKSDSGELTVAVKTTDAGGGNTHFEYAVYNHDFYRKLDSFEVPIPVGASVTNIGFHDIDTNAGNEWTATVLAGRIRFDAPAGNELDWGTLYNFRFDVDTTAIQGQLTLGIANPGTAQNLLVTTLVPNAPAAAIFADGFDSGNVSVWSIASP
jgi:hypothetical protein